MRDRAKIVHGSLFKLDKYREGLSSMMQQSSEVSLNERSNGGNAAKLGSQIYRHPREIMA